MSSNLTNLKYRSLITGTDEFQKYRRQRLGIRGSLVGNLDTSILGFFTQDSFALIATFSVTSTPDPGSFLACDYNDIEDVNNSFFYTNSGPNDNTSGFIGKYNIFGSQSWSYNHGSEVRAVAVDRNDFVYIGGLQGTGTLTTRKLSATGSVLWSVNSGLAVNDIAVDSSGNVYTGGQRTSNLTTRKYGPTGSLLWSVDHGASVGGIVVNSSGDLYTVGQRNANIGATNSTTRKYNSSGTLQWSRDHGAGVVSITMDATGNIYTSGDTVSNITTRKYDSSGLLIWSLSETYEQPPPIGSQVSLSWRMVIDVSQNLYTTDGINIRKYDLDGNLLGKYPPNLYPAYPQLFNPLGLATHPSTKNQL